MRKKLFISITTIFLLLSTFIFAPKGNAQTSLTLFTPYTGVSVSPGEVIDYDVQIINDSSSVQTVRFQVDDLPDDWDYNITASGKGIKQLSILPDSEETIRLEVTVPLEIEKGDYPFELIAKGRGNVEASLPFLATVTEEGMQETEFTSDQANMQGHAEANFSYSATIYNRTQDTQNYSLNAQLPEGWQVQFKSAGNNVTSVSVEPNSTQAVTIEVQPANNVKAGTYEIPVFATTGNTSAELLLEAVITGTYDMELTTPNGLLSTDVTAGKTRTVDLVVKNNGTSKLTNIELTASTPPRWETEFDTNTINEIEPGESKTVQAKITAPDDAIAGDYVVTFTADTNEVSSDANFRVSVGTTTAWGFMGVLIILGVCGGMFTLFKKYGRR